VYGLHAALTTLVWAAGTFACLAQAAPPQAVTRAGLVPGASGCDAIFAGGFYGTAPAPAASTTPSNQAAAAATNDNSFYGGNVPLYGNDLNGNFPLYSTPDLGATAPLYSIPTPGINAPLYSDPAFRLDRARGNYAEAPGNIRSGGTAAPLTCRNFVPLGQWVLYPSVRIYSQSSDNWFLSPTTPLKTIDFGVTPTLNAQWTNGIHSTTIFGTVDAQYYPTTTFLNQANPQARLTQTYSPLPDLTFSANANFLHQNISSALTNSIPTAVNQLPATPSLLPNGNIQLPNGNIVAPNGQVVGNTIPALAQSGITAINPFNQYSASVGATKILNGGIVSLSGSTNRTDYEQPQGSGPQAFTTITSQVLSGSWSFALGPLLYAYSNGSVSVNNENSSPAINSSAYRAIGGIGTARIGLLSALGYAGHQGSSTQGGGASGGNVYGASISYFPTFAWTIILRYDHTDNFSSQSAPSQLALTLPLNVPIQVALSSSSRISIPSLQTIYEIAPKWHLRGNVSYSHIEFIGTTNYTNAFFASATLSYDIWRNMTLTGEYQFSDVQSNLPGQSAERNLFLVSAEYRF
jgi:hypothetical protein